jgi:hypothetical protein
MNGKQIGLSLVLLDLLALDGYAVYHYGSLGFVDLLLANAVTVSVLVDLTIALVLAIAWVWRDARARGVSPVPYLVLTLLLGSVGPLAYLIRREASEPTAVLEAGRAATAH